MKYISAKEMVVFGLIFIFLLLWPASAFAHLMLIEPVEEGKVQVVFDDGSPNRHAKVIVYDDENREIAGGDVDREGYFTYPADEAALLVAEDNFGHRAEYEVGEEPHAALPRLPAVSAVLAFFALIAGIFHLRVKNKKPGPDKQG